MRGGDGIDVNAAGEFGLTPLMLAVQSLRMDLVLLLLESKANVLLSDQTGSTVIEHAIGSSGGENTEMVRALRGAAKKWEEEEMTVGFAPPLSSRLPTPKTPGLMLLQESNELTLVSTEERKSKKKKEKKEKEKEKEKEEDRKEEEENSNDSQHNTMIQPCPPSATTLSATTSLLPPPPGQLSRKNVPPPPPQAGAAPKHRRNGSKPPLLL